MKNTKTKRTAKARSGSLERVVRPLHRDHKLMLQAIGTNLRAARNKIGLTLPTLCKLSGVSKGNLSKIENGKGNLTAVTLYRLCWSIGIHPRAVLPPYRHNDKLSDAAR